MVTLIVLCRSVEEKIGMLVRHADIIGGNSCMHVCGMEDIKILGTLFT